jgi:predicted MFS family arabinose efflux permease
MRKNHFLFICSFIYNCSINILSFSLVFILEDRFAFTSGQVGACMAGGSFVYFLGCWVYQHTGKSGKPRRIIPTSVGVCIAAVFVLSLAQRAPLAVFAYFVAQGTTSFFWLPVMTWFTNALTGKELNRDIGYFNLSWMSGSLFAPLLGGTLYHLNRVYVFPAVLSGLFLALFSLYILSRYSEKKGWQKDPLRTEVREPGTDKAAETLPQAVRDSLAMFKIQGWCGAFCCNMVNGMLIYIMPLHIRNSLGASEQTVGQILLFRGLGALTGFSILARTSRWHFNRRWFILVQGLLIFDLVLFMALGSFVPAYFFLSFLVGLLYSGSYNNSLFHSSASPENPEKNLSFHEIFLSSGSVLGSLCGGMIYQYFGLYPAFLLLALIQAGCLLFFIRGRV